MNLPDARGWVAIGLFALTFFVLSLLAFDPKLAEIQLFSVLAQAIVLSGLIGGPVLFLYGASKSSSDAASKAQDSAK